MIAARAGAPRHHEQLFGHLARLQGRADQQHQRQVDHAEPPASVSADASNLAPRTSTASARSNEPGEQADCRSPDRAAPEITAIRSASDSIAAASTVPSARIGCPDISGEPRSRVAEDRRRDVGRRARTRRCACCPRSGCRRSRAQRSRSASASFFSGGAARSRSADRRRAVRTRTGSGAGSNCEFRRLEQGAGGGFALNFFGGALPATPGPVGEKYKALHPPLEHPTPAASRLEASSPGTIVGGSGSGPFAHSSPPAGGSPAHASGQRLVVERIEDPVALADVEVGLLGRHGPQAGAQHPRREPGSRQLVDASALGRTRGHLGHDRLLGSDRPRVGGPRTFSVRRSAVPPAPPKTLSGGPRPEPAARAIQRLSSTRWPTAPSPSSRSSSSIPPGGAATPELRAADKRRVPRRLRGLRPGPLAARLLDRRHARATST